MILSRLGKSLAPVLALLLAGLVATAAFSWMRVRTEMADFLPAGRTEAARLMLDQLRHGAAASLILIGVEGAPEPELARISRTLAAGMQQSGRFALVQNGADLLADMPLWDQRLLLSPAVTAKVFTVPALRRSLQAVVAALNSAAGPLVARFAPADPIGAYLAMAQAFGADSRVRMVDGVWFAPDRPRALIVAATRAQGLDLAGQDEAAAALDRAFANASPGAARLLASGPAVFARAAANAIRGDIRTVSIVSTLLVAGLLVWRFRSPLVIAAIAMPVVLGITAAAVATQAVFGFVHGVALGFGMTMLGVTVDYPVIMVGHRKRGEPAQATVRRIGGTFGLAVATATLGLLGLAMCGFPGIEQLGVFAIAGLLAAAAATRFLLPPLIVAANLAPVAAGESLLGVERLRRFRVAALVVVLGVVALAQVPRWNSDLAALSPVPREALALDESLRADLGVPDAGQVVVVRGRSPQEVLGAEEALRPVFDALAASGAIRGVEMAAALLPSQAIQRNRQRALPDPATLTARLTEAAAGLGFAPGAFEPFVAAVAAARTAAPVRPTDLPPVVAARLSPLLQQRGDEATGLMALRGVADTAAVARVLAGTRATYVDIGAETGRLVQGAAARAWGWLAASAMAALMAMWLGLRDSWRVARVAGAVAIGGLLTVAGLTLAGVRLSLIHVLALQFVTGIGLDYALFFARRQIDAEERARTLRTLVTCNAMTVLTFGTLAFCRTPLLRDLGATVAAGAVATMCCAFLFVGLNPRTAR